VILQNLASRSANGGMLGAATNDGARTRVTEEKAAHVPLKHRLKFTHDEKMVIAGRVQHNERDGLNGAARTNYGTDNHVPIYREVPANEQDEESAPLIRGRQVRARCLHTMHFSRWVRFGYST
jgi:hypothetical protein